MKTRKVGKISDEDKKIKLFVTRLSKLREKYFAMKKKLKKEIVEEKNKAKMEIKKLKSLQDATDKEISYWKDMYEYENYLNHTGTSQRTVSGISTSPILSGTARLSAL